MFGLTVIRESEYPFVRDIKRLIAEKPEYAEGIKDGVVHLSYNPGQRPKEAVSE